MKKISRYEAMQKARRYDGVILRLQKNRSRQILLTVFTRQQGLMQVWAPAGKKGYDQGFGSLLDFSFLTFEAWQRGQSFSLGEYESRQTPLLDNMTWDRYVYTQLLVEIVQQLMPPGAADERVYSILTAYAAAIASRNICAATVIAGWQVTACAGFMPDTEQVQVYRSRAADSSVRYYLSDSGQPPTDKSQNVQVQEVPVDAGIRKLWQELLVYDWRQKRTLKLSKKGLYFLTGLLCSYVEQLSSKELKCRKLLPFATL